MAGAALSKGQVGISLQAQYFRKVKYRFLGRRSAFARSSIDFVAALPQGQVERQAQLFRRVRYRFLCRRSTFARSSGDFAVSAAFLQG